MRADRLLALLLVLQTRGKTTAADLAAELEVSVRTIYRDLEALSAAGVPVWAEGGPGGGCQLMEGYRSPLVGVTAEEAIALLAATSSTPLVDSGLGDDLAAAKLRLLAALPAETRQEVLAAVDRFHIDAPAWFRPALPVPHLASLVHAVRAERRIRLTYPGRTPGAVLVDPLGLVAKAGRWYLVGTSKGRHLVYRADRVTKVELLAEGCQRPDGFDLAGFWGNWSEEFESGTHRVAASVRIHPQLWEALPEVFGEAVLAKMEASDEPDETGWRMIDLSFESVPAARTRLLGLGAQVEVISPARVRQAVAAAAAEVALLYRR